MYFSPPFLQVSVQCSNSRPESRLYHDPTSMAVLCVLLAIGSLMLFGTFYDTYVHRPMEEQAKAMAIGEVGNWGKIFFGKFGNFKIFGLSMDTDFYKKK